MTALPDLSSGNCRNDPDPDMWFNDKATRRDAHELCEGCPILEPCRADALTHHVHGVWGGLSEKQRAELRRKPPAARKPATTTRTRCIRGHDLTLVGAVRMKRSGAQEWPTCVECRREDDRARSGKKAS